MHPRISRSRRSATVFVLALAAALVAPPGTQAADEEQAHPLASMPLRTIGPAISSGRIADLSFHPDKPQEFLAAVASGNLWKTTDDTTTWTPVFDDYGAYAVGVIARDPQDPDTVWIGTGENKAQRSVGYGDGVYKSIDGGNTWTHEGLKDSGHIGHIWIHPDDSDFVLVAAHGPLWSDGGDRGLYRSTDGGETWARILAIDEHTGVNEFVVDPADPDTIVAASYQRRRHVWTLINGGPGSGIHKTTDGGETWTEITAGLPEDNMGKIGISTAPSAPDILYAIIEANEEEQGVYRSTDFGNSWEKRSDHMTTSPQYYNELVIDPLDADRVYALDTVTHVSEDGGRTWRQLGMEFRHVDDHALWIDPDNTDHFYIGGDGGIYETWDGGTTWRHVRNLPVTQFYRIQPDNAEPFYNVCGGTQDNNSLCAPSRTTVVHGITNSDWTFVLGGDGYKPQFDPNDPNIIYAQYQYGGLVRYDRRTRERIAITPLPESGEKNYKWNWNTPLLVSPHDPHRLYYAAEYLFRSDDRGDSWEKVSPDLTRGLDRNKLEVMGRVWSVDTIAKNDSTSIYGAAIGLSESPVLEGVIYVGTDDGVMNVTSDGGETWRRTTSFPGVPDMSLIEDVVASVHDPDVAYAVFDNHKRGDYKPYVLKTADRGRSWRPITGDLPARGSAHTIAEDHVNPDLLFVGTEFGLYFTQDGGESWHELTGGDFPTIAVRDLEIQRRENDLVVGTFGRGIWILDDYTPLRTPADELGDTELFPVRDPWLYIEGYIWDDRGKGSMGSGFYAAPNPPYGAMFSYYLEEPLLPARKERRRREIEVEIEGGDTPYPDWEVLRAEDREEEPQLLLLVRDAEGRLVRQVSGETEEGFHRSAWDLRLPPPDPIVLGEPEQRMYWESEPVGPLALPGQYSVQLARLVDGELTTVGLPEAFTVKPLENSPEITDDRRALQAFQLKAAELQRAVKGAVQAVEEYRARIDHLQAALLETPGRSPADFEELVRLSNRLADVAVALTGDTTVASRNEPAAMPVATRVNTIYTSQVWTQFPVPAQYETSYDIAAREFSDALSELRGVRDELRAIESRLEGVGAPWTPGRLPDWQAP
ncbi:WD40/YVTN/BNR-like repeat-containing protein [Lentisalinibacter salinarum]|uniref:WD40/YVTN/BNR-like repeat-containing protein n=1 Tax=Lentisalinibacter salinarum TaxID=2992239 RepID=UPI00386FDD4A